MPFQHGVYINEIATGVRPPVRVSAGLPVFVGTAPINLGDVTAVNKPIVCYTLAEYEASFGPIAAGAWGSYTLHEAAAAAFRLFGIAPIVCVNVLNPADSGHYTAATAESHTLSGSGTATATHFGALLSTVVVKVSGTAKTLGTDYTLDFDDAGMLVVTRVSTGGITGGATITLDYHYLNPAGVDASDIIGGYSAGAYKGLECVEQVFPMRRLVPGLLVAPKWSQDPTVAARMNTIGRSVNGIFKALAVVDLSSDTGDIASYADAAAWKADNGYTGAGELVGWGLAKFGDDVYHLSTIAACVANVVDAARNGIPYASPSNQTIAASAMVLDDGSEVFLTPAQANALNAQGITTLLNFSAWKLWGNRTGAYPDDTDPRNAFIPIRRMFDWIGNTIALTVARDVDQPGNRRLIDGVMGTVQTFLNSLVAQGALVAGVIEFREGENSTTDMSDGRYTFHLTLTPPSPGESLEFVLEYDPAALAALR